MVGKNSREFNIQTVIQSLFLFAKTLSENKQRTVLFNSDVKLRSCGNHIVVGDHKKSGFFKLKKNGLVSN